MNAVSEAISKGIPTHSIRDCFALSEKGLAMTLIASGFAHRNDALKRRRGSAGGSLRSPPPFASLTQSTNDSWWIFTLLNKDTFNRVNIKPLRGLDEFAFS